MDHGSEDEAAMIVIEWFDDVDEAKSSAAALVENGVGAVLDRDSPPRTGLAVLTDDASRARSVLGLEPDLDVDESEDLLRMSRAWLIPVMIFGLAMILVPLVAFFVSFKLSGG